MPDQNLRRHEKEIPVLNPHSEISRTSQAIVSNCRNPSNLPSFQISERPKNRTDLYRMPESSNPEKELSRRLHEAIQLDYVNLGPVMLSEPATLAEAVNKRWHEIFQKGPSTPLPHGIIEQVYSFILFR